MKLKILKPNNAIILIKVRIILLYPVQLNF
nr:MAG TPA: hypothetical protein [Caudoviricetes sp.]